MYDARGRFTSRSRIFSRRHSTGMWQTRTILDFPSTRADGPGIEAPGPASRGSVRKSDIESLLAEVAELGALLGGKPRTPGEIRPFPGKSETRATT